MTTPNSTKRFFAALVAACILLLESSSLHAQMVTHAMPPGGEIGMLETDGSIILAKGLGKLYTSSATTLNWQLKDFYTTGNPYIQDYSVSNNTVYGITYTGALYQLTTLFVSSWQLVPMNTSFIQANINDFAVTNAYVYYATDSGVYIYNRTTASHVLTQPDPASPWTYQLKLIGSDVYAIIGNKVYKYVSSSNTWVNEYTIPMPYGVNTLTVNGANVCISANNGIRNFMSTDNGLTWTQDPLPVPFGSSYTCYANGQFYSLLGINYSNMNTYQSSKLLIRHGATPTAMTTDTVYLSRFYDNQTNFAILSATLVSNKIIIAGSEGIGSYDVLTGTFSRNNTGIKNNYGQHMAINSNYHFIGASDGLYLKDVAASTITKLENLPPENFNGINPPGYTLPLLSISSSNNLYIATAGKIYKSQNLGATWQSIADSVVDMEMHQDTLLMLKENRLLISLDGGNTIITKPITAIPAYTSAKVSFRDSIVFIVTMANLTFQTNEYISTNFGTTFTLNPMLGITLGGAPIDYVFHGNDIYTKSASGNNLSKRPITGGTFTNVPIATNASSLSSNMYNFVFWFENDKLYVSPNDYSMVLSSSNGGQTFTQLSTVNYYGNLSDSRYFTQTDVGAAFYCMGIPNYQTFVDNSMGTASGSVFYDVNGNQVKDSMDVPVPYCQIKCGNYISFTGQNGSFMLSLPQTTNMLEVINTPLYHTPFPLHYIANAGDTGLNFLLLTQANQHDLSVSMSTIGQFRPGFKRQLHAAYRNVGTATQDATATFVNDPNLIALSIVPPPDSLSGDTLYWNLVQMQPLDVFHVTIVDSVPTVLALGTNLYFESSIYSDTTDLTPYNNTKVLDLYEVIGSCDPNEKHVDPAEYTTDDYLAGEFLTYTILFQNTGTASAITVKLVDTLSAMLDLSSFEVLSSSHPGYSLSILNGNVLVINYPNINLPDSNSNELASHGYFSFKIKAKNNWLLNSSIHNTAQIYFDFNAPITTNTVSTTLTLPIITSISSTSAEVAVSIVPNPTQQCFKFSSHLPLNQASYTIVDAVGKEVSNGKLLSKDDLIDTSMMPQGLYFVKLTLPNGDLSSLKLVKN